MPDRRRHAVHRLPRLALRESQPQPSPAEEERDNPFAAPPEGRPDRPWQPRTPATGNPGPSGGGDGNGDGGGESGQDQQGEHSGQRPAWGSQWSSRQPGRQGGGFGGGQGPGGGPGGPGGLRWDPTDPAQRRARYALLAGMWGFFFALFSIPQVALLLGALSIYWGISSLRAKPRP
ncbi:hypothetical protein K6I33_006487, partial [Streptomyces sp. UNOB3_S3]|nr:hypothetical protein [Streptomyces sp. UNOB3_S3]